MATRYYISLKDPEKARGNDPAFSFSAQRRRRIRRATAGSVARRRPVPALARCATGSRSGGCSLGAIDPGATVKGEQHNLQIDLIVVTTIPGSVFKHRLRLLAGNAWELRDVSTA